MQPPCPFFAQQPSYLLTGKVFCGTCGSTYGKVGKLRSACHARTNYGAAGCSNDLTIRIGELEQQVLATLQDEMMQPDVVEAFVAEYIAESNRIARRNDSARAERERELKEVGASIARLTAAVLKGVDAALFADELNRLGRRKAVLEAELAGPKTETRPALLHPRLAQVYRAKVAGLVEALRRPETQAEAQEIVRGVIDRIVLTPVDGVLQIDVRDDLATMLVLGSETRQASEACASEA